jgi:hypothetical protein
VAFALYLGREDCEKLHVSGALRRKIVRQMRSPEARYKTTYFTTTNALLHRPLSGFPSEEIPRIISKRSTPAPPPTRATNITICAFVKHTNKKKQSYTLEKQQQSSSNSN